MILVIANVTVQDGKQETFIDSAKKLVVETLKEAGNISYELKHDVNDKCLFTFVEHWQSTDALDLHMASNHFKTFGASIETLLAKDLDVKVYDANLIG